MGVLRTVEDALLPDLYDIQANNEAQPNVTNLFTKACDGIRSLMRTTSSDAKLYSELVLQRIQACERSLSGSAVNHDILSALEDFTVFLDISYLVFPTANNWKGRAVSQFVRPRLARTRVILPFCRVE
jgi:hypothetical protein